MAAIGLWVADEAGDPCHGGPSPSKCVPNDAEGLEENGAKTMVQLLRELTGANQKLASNIVLAFGGRQGFQKSSGRVAAAELATNECSVQTGPATTSLPRQEL